MKSLVYSPTLESVHPDLHAAISRIVHGYHTDWQLVADPVKTYAASVTYLRCGDYRSEYILMVDISDNRWPIALVPASGDVIFVSHDNVAEQLSANHRISTGEWKKILPRSERS